jgi:hypothetical protein
MHDAPLHLVIKVVLRKRLMVLRQDGGSHSTQPLSAQWAYNAVHFYACLGSRVPAVLSPARVSGQCLLLDTRLTFLFDRVHQHLGITQLARSLQHLGCSLEMRHDQMSRRMHIRMAREAGGGSRI